ncbi:MAG: ABC transporter substrate-binding protein [Acidobacteria bacterium]|nr:ABC transporter substrate-binding protein [Acidobacteriota bacterium]
MRNRSTASKFAAVLMAGTLVLAACGDDESSTATTAAPAPETTAAPAPETTAAPAPETTAGTADPLAALYQECLDNGAKVNLIALPDEWANYKGILQSFRDKYPGVENPVASPDASSKEEMEAVQTLAGQADMPDNVDVSPAIAQEMVDAGLFEPYVLTSDAEIPAGLKDAANNWTAAYYGIMAITTNTTIVPTAPKSFADLTKPEYKGLVALNGDPREAGSAFAAVMAASIANGGSADDIMPGIQFFADLKASGNLGGTDVTKETVLSGETPIAIDWSYNVPGLKADLEAAGLTVEVNFPSDGIYGGFYGQGVVKNSPNQACSKLWMEHIFSDEGALGYLEGGAVPARIDALVKAGKVTEDSKKNLPPEELLSQVNFLTPAQIAAAKAVLAEQWGPMVADA